MIDVTKFFKSFYSWNGTIKYTSFVNITAYPFRFTLFEISNTSFVMAGDVTVYSSDVLSFPALAFFDENSFIPGTCTHFFHES